MQRAIAPDEDLVVTSFTRNGYITSYGIPQLDWNTELFCGHIGMSRPRAAMALSAVLPRTDRLVARQRGTAQKIFLRAHKNEEVTVTVRETGQTFSECAEPVSARAETSQQRRMAKRAKQFPGYGARS
eukprot:5147484-Pleurochrysis_carterae.AAC.1